MPPSAQVMLEVIYVEALQRRCEKLNQHDGLSDWQQFNAEIVVSSITT